MEGEPSHQERQTQQEGTQPQRQASDVPPTTTPTAFRTTPGTHVAASGVSQTAAAISPPEETSHKPHSRKRASESIEEGFSFDAGEGEGEDDSRKIEARRAYNRQCAARARKRNKDLIFTLQNQVNDLEHTKARLERTVEVMRAQMDLLEQQNRSLIMNQQQQQPPPPHMQPPHSAVPQGGGAGGGPVHGYPYAPPGHSTSPPLPHHQAYAGYPPSHPYQQPPPPPHNQPPPQTPAAHAAGVPSPTPPTSERMHAPPPGYAYPPHPSYYNVPPPSYEMQYPPAYIQQQQQQQRPYHSSQPPPGEPGAERSAPPPPGDKRGWM